MGRDPATSRAGTLNEQAFALTAAQIRASAQTPVTLVAAPGADQILVPLLVTYAYTFVSVAYNSGVFTIAAAGGTVAGIADASSVVGRLILARLDGAARASVVNKPVTLALLGAGPIATSTLLDGGALYAANDTGNLGGGSGSSGTYRVLTVSGGGAILTYTITNPGTGYEVGDQLQLNAAGAQPGLGSGAEITVATIDSSTEAGNGLLGGTVYYVVNPL